MLSLRLRIIRDRLQIDRQFVERSRGIAFGDQARARLNRAF